jgi:tetratricopeptide (TPR) repeat protein
MDVVWRARMARSAFRMLVDPRGISTDDVREELRRAIAAFEELGDEAGLATAWRRLAETEWLPCRYDDASEGLRRAVEHARRAGDAGLLQYASGMLLATDLFGSTPPGEAMRRLDAALGELPEAGLVGEHLGVVHRSVLHAMLGDIEEARRLFDVADANAKRVGVGYWLTASLQWRGFVEEWAGEPERAERAARECHRIEIEQGDTGHASTGAGNLARALCQLGRTEEAEVFAREARETAAEDDLSSQVTGRSAQALALSARGRHEEAIALAREAVDMFAETQSPDFQANSWKDLAEVLLAAGLADEARSAADEALARHEGRGNLLAARSVRAFIGSLETEDG